MKEPHDELSASNVPSLTSPAFMAALQEHWFTKVIYVPEGE